MKNETIVMINIINHYANYRKIRNIIANNTVPTK